MKAVQATHHQGDTRYSVSSGSHCSCMSRISVSWTLFKSPGRGNKFLLDSILTKGNQLYNFIGKFRYLGIEDLPQGFFIENISINVEFLDNKREKYTARALQKLKLVFSKLGPVLYLSLAIIF